MWERERQQTWGAIIIILKFILFCWGVAQGLVYVLSTRNTEFHSSPSLDSFHHTAKANLFKKFNSPFDYASLYIYFKNKGHKLFFFLSPRKKIIYYIKW